MNIAIVTGASSGLGREFVMQLDKTEALDEIWVLARRRERLEELKQIAHTALRVLPCDLAEPRAIDELSALLAEEQPSVRVLINAAGFGKIGSYQDIDLADCGRMIDLNCRAAVSVTQTVLPYMHEGSRILQICSTSSFQPFPYLNIYAATKAFLYRYTRALRVELKKTGILVTAVCPYWIKDTEFIGTAQKTADSRYIKRFPLASRRENVAEKALRDSRRGRAVSTPGIICTLHRFVAKLLPSALMMDAWAMLRKF